MRIGLYTDTHTKGKGKNWVGSLASTAAFSASTSNSNIGNNHNPRVKFTLFLDGADRVYHVGLSRVERNGKENGNGNGEVEVEFVRDETSPLPALNRPIVKTPGAQGEEEVEEKTLLQR